MAEAFQQARTRSREAIMLDVRLKDGTVESFDYALPKRVTYTPQGMLVLRFGQATIKVQGSNLERVRQAVTEGRAKSIGGDGSGAGPKAGGRGAYRAD